MVKPLRENSVLANAPTSCRGSMRRWPRITNETSRRGRRSAVWGLCFSWKIPREIYRNLWKSFFCRNLYIMVWIELKWYIEIWTLFFFANIFPSWFESSWNGVYIYIYRNMNCFFSPIFSHESWWIIVVFILNSFRFRSGNGPVKANRVMILWCCESNPPWVPLMLQDVYTWWFFRFIVWTASVSSMDCHMSLFPDHSCVECLTMYYVYRCIYILYIIYPMHICNM